MYIVHTYVRAYILCENRPDFCKKNSFGNIDDLGPFYGLTKSGRIVRLASLAVKNILLTPKNGGGT